MRTTGMPHARPSGEMAQQRETAKAPAIVSTTPTKKGGGRSHRPSTCSAVIPGQPAGLSPESISRQSMRPDGFRAWSFGPSRNDEVRSHLAEQLVDIVPV